MRHVFLGSPPFGTPVLRHLIESRHVTAGVVTPPDRPRGRGRRVEPSSVAQLATENGVELLQPETAKDPDFVERLRRLEPDALIVASYGEILRRDVLELAPHGALNVHASLLPRWRGASPIQRAIAAGDEETGVSIQRVVLALDEGDVLLERRIPIEPHDTAGDLLPRLAELGGEAIVEALERLEAGTATFTPQDPAQATYAKKLCKEDGRIDWTRPASELERHVRAMQPWPGARTSLPDGRELVVLRAEVEPEPDAEPSGGTSPGAIADDPKSLRVQTGSGRLHLLEVKPAGKGAMSGEAFLRGARLAAGQTLGA